MGITIWILLQPNLSTAIVMIVLWFAMLWASGLSLKIPGCYSSLAACSLPTWPFPFLVDYQQRRILNFIFPDPNARYGETYNIQQALISHRLRRLVRAGLWARHAGAIALLESALVGFYLFRYGSGIRLCGVRCW